VFQAFIVLRGARLPGVEINVEKKGLELLPYDIRNRYEGPSSVAAFFLFLLAFALVFAGLAVFLVRVERKRILKRDEELMNQLKLSLSDDKTKEELKLGVEADTFRLASYFVRMLQRFRWEKVPTIFRAFSSYPPPQDAK
jgi:hypothetical protein